jgi:hypothetical protein
LIIFIFDDILPPPHGLEHSDQSEYLYSQCTGVGGGGGGGGGDIIGIGGIKGGVGMLGIPPPPPPIFTVYI